MSAGRQAIAQSLEACGVVAIIRLKDGAALPRVVDALAEGGVRALEITMTVPGAVGHIRQVASTLPAGFVLGAGTVLTADTALEVADAGARGEGAEIGDDRSLEIHLAAPDHDAGRDTCVEQPDLDQ